jgi:hypothetical protein
MRLGMITGTNGAQLIAARGQRVFWLNDPAIPADPLSVLLDTRLQQRVNSAAAQSHPEVDLASATLLPPLAVGQDHLLMVTGSPAESGSPPLFMKHADVCEVEVQSIGHASQSGSAMSIER